MHAPYIRSDGKGPLCKGSAMYSPLKFSDTAFHHSERLHGRQSRASPVTATHLRRKLATVRPASRRALVGHLERDKLGPGCQQRNRAGICRQIAHALADCAQVAGRLCQGRAATEPIAGCHHRAHPRVAVVLGRDDARVGGAGGQCPDSGRRVVSRTVQTAATTSAAPAPAATAAPVTLAPLATTGRAALELP
jgi:hypothetical protein